MVVDTATHIVKCGFNITPSNFHMISNTESANGCDMSYIADVIKSFLHRCDGIVSFNLDFQMGSELYHHNRKTKLFVIFTNLEPETPESLLVILH